MLRALYPIAFPFYYDYYENYLSIYYNSISSVSSFGKLEDKLTSAII